MNDDDDIRSPATVSSSPSPSPPPTDTLPHEVNSRALVVTPLQLPRTTATAVAVHSGGRSGGGGREDCWSEGATGVLIDAWGERYLELSRGNLKQKHWKEVAEIVSSREDYSKPAKTDIQCKNRIDTVKKKYKLEKAKIAAGGGPSRWGFFERLDDLIGPNAKVTPPGGGGGGGGGGSSSGDGGPSVALFGNVPLGIPVPTGIRSTKHYPRRGRGSGNDDGGNPNRNGRTQIRKQQGRSRVESEEEEEDDEEAEGEGEGEGEGYSDDSLPPVEKRQRVRVGVSDVKKKEERKGCGSSSSVRLLEEAMCKFGDAYERAERAKLQQVMEMEKTRMKFLKELELQRMQFFMKTQMEISQLRHGRTQSNASHQQHYNHSNRHTGNNVNNNK